MEVYGQLLQEVINFMKIEFDLFGWTVSYWQMFLFDCIAGIVALVINHFTG